MSDFIGIDFTKSRKDTIKFTLPGEGGGEGFEISVLPPTKRMFDALSRLGEIVDAWEDGDLEAGGFDMGKALEAVSEAMSHNAQMRPITVEYLESINFDITDVADFVTAYLYFLMRLVEEKNSFAPGLTREK